MIPWWGWLLISAGGAVLVAWAAIAVFCLVLGYQIWRDS